MRGDEGVIWRCFRAVKGFLRRVYFSRQRTHDSSVPNVQAFMNEALSNKGNEGFMYVKNRSKRVR